MDKKLILRKQNYLNPLKNRHHMSSKTTKTQQTKFRNAKARNNDDMYIYNYKRKKKIIYQKSSNVFQSLQKELSCKYQGKMENLDPYYTYTNKMKEKKI